jgi:hypothetical protein
MGWKSTKFITREKAIQLILTRIYDERTTDTELEDAVEGMGYGDNSNLPYYGHNFRIVAEEDLDKYNNN